jgi:hypothetical protein
MKGNIDDAKMRDGDKKLRGFSRVEPEKTNELPEKKNQT